MTPKDKPAGPVLTVSVIDDDESSCELVQAFLSSMGCEVQSFTDARQALAAFRASPPDLVITDIHMPGDLDGLGLLKLIKEERPLIEVIMITGAADKDLAIKALRLGAFDFLEKPFSLPDLVTTVKRTVRYRTIHQEAEGLVDRLSMITKQEFSRWGIEAFVGKSDAIRKMLIDIRLLQKAPNTSVLITGESGTGKELVARAIHFGSNRSTRPFLVLSCGAVTAGVADTMLFGHRQGAFPGAATDRKGLFETADKGTVFLDEVGELPLELQAKLLRVLEDGIVVPVGGVQGVKVNVRIVAATNSPIQSKIDAGAFRSDLFYRLAAFPFIIPPLREHAEDIPLLAKHFALKLSAEMGLQCPDITADALSALKEYPFPGNVRELKNKVERALIECAGKCIALKHVHFKESLRFPGTRAAGAVSDEIPSNLHEAERILAARVMEKTKGNVSAAAIQMGISRAKLYRLIKTDKADHRPSRR